VKPQFITDIRGYRGAGRKTIAITLLQELIEGKVWYANANYRLSGIPMNGLGA
jgi:hypothetical protein